MHELQNNRHCLKKSSIDRLKSAKPAVIQHLIHVRTQPIRITTVGRYSPTKRSLLITNWPQLHRQNNITQFQPCNSTVSLRLYVRSCTVYTAKNNVYFGTLYLQQSFLVIMCPRLNAV